MGKVNSIMRAFRKRRGLLIVITAALLLELLSASQYYFTHSLMERELEKRAEGELTLKAILVKSTLSSAEDILNNHIWDIRESLSHPDSVTEAIGRMIVLSRSVLGGTVAFVPDYYPAKGRLFEPYALRQGDSIVKSQIAGERHDYTASRFYKSTLATGKSQWIEPYEDSEGAQTSVISYSVPLYDNHNEQAGVAVVDVSQKWLGDTIDRRHIYPSSFLLLLTEGGEPIIRPSESRISKSTTDSIIRMINDSSVVRQNSLSGRSKVIHFDTDERDGTVYYANMKGIPHWQIAVVCYDDEVFAPLSKLRIRMLLLMLLAFGVLLYMIARFVRNDRKLKEKTMEQERIAGELRIASGIQQALLPQDEDSLTGVEDVCVEGRLIPAKEVGGDLYNAFVRDGKLFFCIGDVSGKGVPSALIMAITQSLFRNIALRESNPAHIMNQLNVAICRNNKANVFVTMFIGVLDMPTGNLRYCNAGHEVPLMLSDGCSMLDIKPNLPIGLFDDFNYEMQQTVMLPGATLLLYTDGLTEARNVEHQLLGRERVVEMIAAMTADDTKRLVENVISRVQTFEENTEQSDDLTLLAVTYTPVEEHYILDEKLTLHNDVREVETLSAFVKDVLARLNIGKPLAPKLRLVMEEAVVNVMEYAYPAGKVGEVDIRVTFDGQRLKFVITDSGVAFNPTEAATADTTLSAEDRPIGGLGILLMRELMDSINYERTAGKNVLTLTKNIVCNS